MESLARWLQKEENAWYPLLRIFAALSAVLFVGCAGEAIYEASTGTAPLIAWVVVSFLFILTIALSIPGLRSLKNRRKGPSLSNLQTAAFTGKLAEALGDRAEILGKAATDLEQIESLLKWDALDEEFSLSLKEAGNTRMRRMVDLTIATPGDYGLTMGQANLQVEEDGRWLAEARALIESNRETSVQSAKDETLSHLQALVQAREEAEIELRA